MPISVQDFIDNINHKKVYYFKSEHIKNSTEPHYFCVVGFDTENVMILTCFTSQIQKKIDFVKSRGLSHSTLVMVDPTTSNGLKKECCINCNDVYLHSKDEFKNMFINSEISEKGELEELYYAQVFIGLNDSIMIEEETKLKLKDIDD